MRATTLLNKLLGIKFTRVPVAEQNIQGGQMSSFYQNNGINPGDEFVVEVVP